MEIIEATNYREDIVTLLSSEKLPASDLPQSLNNFLVVVENDKLIGVIGLETYDHYGLLRSLAVHPNSRNQNIAGKLVAQLEKLALAKGLKSIFLLTETAQDYFSRKGYQAISRAEMPAEVQKSSEFSHVCPQSAVAMKKDL
jgi:amino-acid N-acetyltransferase